jgi:glycosyltransferase involved in cell wall biosynthesis
MINYSIIIPHKDCPELLNRCLDSIPKRGDLQIIVVDDNSDSDKKPVVNRKDVEVVLLDGEHAKGAGRARNVGLDMARGKWLLFADADDCYTDNLPQLLDRFANDNTTDIVYLNAYKFDDNDNVYPLRIERLIRNYTEGKKYAEQDLRYGFWTPWTRMVKREVVVKNGIRFEEVPIGNDVMFGFKVSMFSNAIGIEEEMVYKYYKWPHGSITGRKRQKYTMEAFIRRGERIAFYYQVGYHSCLNLFVMIEYHLRKRQLTLRQALAYYFQYLKEYDIFLPKDIACYLYELTIVRIPRRCVSVFRTDVW